MAAIESGASRDRLFTAALDEFERGAAALVAVLQPLPPGPELAMACCNRSQLDMLAHEVDPAWGLRYLVDGIAYCGDRDLDSWKLYMLALRARARFEQVDWNGAEHEHGSG